MGFFLFILAYTLTGIAVLFAGISRGTVSINKTNIRWRLIAIILLWPVLVNFIMKKKNKNAHIRR